MMGAGHRMLEMWIGRCCYSAGAVQREAEKLSGRVEGMTKTLSDEERETGRRGTACGKYALEMSFPVVFRDKREVDVLADE